MDLNIEIYENNLKAIITQISFEDKTCKYIGTTTENR